MAKTPKVGEKSNIYPNYDVTHKKNKSKTSGFFSILN